MSYTLLESVNYVIAQIGSAPVDVLTDPLPNVAKAQARIDEASVKVQKRGWWFNRSYCLPIDKDVDDKYPIPDDTIKILVPSLNYALERGGFAYDPYTQTDTFPDGEATIYVDIIHKVVFDELPYVVQDVIRLVAAREHVMIELEDTRKADSYIQDISAAMADLKKDDLEIKRRNVVYGPKFIATRGGVRPYRLGGRSVNPTIPGGGR